MADLTGQTLARSKGLLKRKYIDKQKKEALKRMMEERNA